MRACIFIFLAATACVSGAPPQLEAGLSPAILGEMRLLSEAQCPAPPPIYELDGIWWVGSFGTVVAVDRAMVAIRRDNPKDWPEDTRHLLMPISARAGDGIKGDAVVVGVSGALVIGRFFQRPYGSPESPAVGDEAWVDHSTSRVMRDSWQAGRRQR
jgi:hypothetical protein